MPTSHPDRDTSYADNTLEAPDVDDNVLAPFPEGTKAVSKTPHGHALWTITSRVEIELPDGKRRVLFLKVVQGDDPGKWMMHGEFETMNAIYQNQPTLAPEPICWNNYKSDPHTWFFLCSFHEFGTAMVDPEPFASKLAALHTKSISPNMKFGFHVHTSIADEEWSDTWEECFVKMIRKLLELELKQWGEDKELQDLSTQLLDTIIPRLLRPLTEDDRFIRPCLVHGDLWYGNTGTDMHTGLVAYYPGNTSRTL